MATNKTIYIVLLVLVGVFLLQQTSTTERAATTQPKGCEANICGGTYTGITDDFGCKIYGLELCKAETTCKSVSGIRLCDPQPFVNGCTWETHDDLGKTYFTKFDHCGLELEQPCGTISQYRCSENTDELCPLEYALGTGDYIEGCGGMK